MTTGERIDLRATDSSDYDWPESRRIPVKTGGRLTAAVDGTYVRSNAGGWLRQHYVVARWNESDGTLGGRFAWVVRDSYGPREIMRAARDDNGWTAEARVTVLADGADGLKEIVHAAIPQTPRNILDLFHMSSRLRPIEQLGRRVADLLACFDPDAAELIRLNLPRLRYQMWHGKRAQAIQCMRSLYLGAGRAMKFLRPADVERVQRFRRHLVELRDYLRNHWTCLINYGHAKRTGLRISSTPADSGMSRLVNQRVGKRHPMCWSLDGAHVLLHVRFAVMDERLERLFREWRPQFRRTPTAVEIPAM